MSASRRQPWRLLLMVVSALMFAACSALPAEQHDPSPTTRASAAPPNYRQLGESIEEAIASGSVALDTIGAVLINVDGQTVLTHYRNSRKPDKTMHVYSVTKSVLSALIGIALDEKLIKDLDSPLSELLPRHRAQMSGDMARVTLRQLLTMSAGFENDDATPSPFADAIQQNGDAVAFILKRGLVSPPGETFTYSNCSAHLVERGPRRGSQASGRVEPADGARLRDREAVQASRHRHTQRLHGPISTRRSDTVREGRLRMGHRRRKGSTSGAASCGSDPPTCSSLDSSTLTTASGRANSSFPRSG